MESLTKIGVHSQVLQLSAYDGIARFDIGTSAAIRTLKKMGINLGEQYLTRSDMADKERVYQADQIN